MISLACILPLLGSVAGCGASSAELPTDVADITSYVVPVQVDYEEPVQIPNTLVDQVGYESASEKAVVFRGENLSDTFAIYDIDSGEQVYTGQILKSVYNEELGEYNSTGYFNDLQREGRYFIFSNELGQSYSFSVGEDVYGGLFDEACKKYYINRCGLALSENYAGDNAHSACHTTVAHLQEDPTVELDVTGGWHMDEQADKDAALGCRIAENLLMAYEMNGSAFGDDSGIPESGNEIPDILDEVRYEVEWLLKMQDTRTGGVYGAAVTSAAEGADLFAAPVFVTPVSMDATIGFASMLARFSYFYQQYDGEFATTCLKAADRAWSCFLNNQKITDNTASFKAAAQLYRATGSSSYHNVLAEFFARSDFKELFDTDENIFLGSVTYLSISQQVDVQTCGILMKYLMKKSEAIAQAASRSTYLVTDAAAKEGFGRMLRDMRCLTITDHIIYNHEYTTIIENHAHYFMGMNPLAVNYVTEDTERTYKDATLGGIMNDPEEDALLIFMLGVLEK
ncbi:MAG: glycoside hydrolase family 9 protein [Butyrivibrio sp.]|nr:glycoside hydrolase family 9 protein [Butyrivibrio sp.]